MKHYYLVASLPTLVLGDTPPIDEAGLLAASEKFLSPWERKELALMLEGRFGEGTSAFAKAWRNIDAQLRNAIAAVRARARGVEARPHLRPHEGYEVAIEKAVTDAYARPNPLERELFLEQYRWARLEDLARQDRFGLSAVLAYAIQLRIALRWAPLTDEAGTNALKGLLEEFEKTSPAVEVERGGRS